MSYNIGPKIGIEGESEFRRQIRDINAEYKSLNAETKAVTAVFEANGDQQGKLQVQSKQLEKQIELQRRKFDLLQDAVKKASDKYGSDSIEVTRLRGAMYDAQATMVTLESQLESTNQDLDNMAAGLDGASDQASDAAQNIDRLAGEVDSANKAAISFSDIFHANLISDVAMSGLREAADLLKKFAAGSIDAAADVKATMSQFEQTFGDASKQAMESLDAISKDTKIATTRMQGDFTKLYAFTKTAGADSATALGIASRAMVAAADNAAYFDRSIEDVTESLQSFLKGNYENDSVLGISATETTRNAKANELYAKSFKELTESQKVDTLLAMVEAGNQASGAIGQAARESDEWTNVMGEAKEAVRQLQAEIGKPALEAAIPIVQKFTDVVKGLAEQKSYEVLAADMDKFSKSVEKSNDAFNASTSSAEAAAAVGGRYVSRLEELERGGLRTADAQREYEVVVDQLNSLIPELNLHIDEQTGLIDQSCNSLRSNIDLLKEKYISEAREEKYAEILGAQADAIVSVEEAEHRLAEAQAHGAQMQSQLSQTGTKLNTVQTEMARIGEKLRSSNGRSSKSTSELRARQAELQEQFGLLGGQYIDLEKSIAENTEEQKKLSHAIEDGQKAVASYDEELDNSVLAAQAAGERQDELSDKIRSTQETVDQLTAEYQEAKESARESIDSQIGYFHQMATESEWTAEEIIQNWDAQKAAFDRYSTNLQKAVDLGLDASLIAQLSDGSEQSMLILDEFVNSTDLSIDDINASFARTSEARDNLAETMDGLKQDYDTKMQELKDAAAKDGIYIVNGLAQSVDRYSYKFENSMQSMAERGHHAFQRKMEINSPSRKMIQDGEYTGEGAIIGVKSKMAEFNATMAQMARSGNTAFLNEKLDMAQGYTQIRNSSVVSTRNHYQTEQNYGGFSFNIYTQPGQDYDRICQDLMRQMYAEVAAKEAGLNG